MKIYTKNGDKGTTGLIREKNLSKSDDRIQLVGTIDELTSNLGVIKTMTDAPDTVRMLEQIQQLLITVMAGVADPYNKDYHISDEPTELLEAEIDRLEALFDRPKQFVLPGGSRLSAQIDVARTVARRAERALALVSVRYGADAGSRKFLNRLADYLYVLARYTDALEMKKREDIESTGVAVPSQTETERPSITDRTPAFESETLSPDMAKRLIDELEKEAGLLGKQMKVKICDSDESENTLSFSKKQEEKQPDSCRKAALHLQIWFE